MSRAKVAGLGGTLLITMAVWLLWPIHQPKSWTNADALVSDLIGVAKSNSGHVDLSKYADVVCFVAESLYARGFARERLPSLEIVEDNKANRSEGAWFVLLVFEGRKTVEIYSVDQRRTLVGRARGDSRGGRSVLRQYNRFQFGNRCTQDRGSLKKGCATECPMIGASRVARALLVYMLSPLPRHSGWATFAHSTQPYQPSPKGLSGRPAHRPFRGLLGVHSRYGLHTRAVTVYRDTLTEGFSHFVTSTAAPVASGWSGCRVGFAPTGERRLGTAHTHS